MQRILPAVIFFWYFFICALPTIEAVTVTTSDLPSSVDQNSEFDVTVQLLCKGCDISYLRGVFYPSGTSYFGYTQNKNGTWINAAGSGCAQYYPLVQSDISPEGTWSGKIKVKPDSTSPLYNGPGEYFFKIARYSSGCSATWSQETIIAISGPIHAPTPTNTPAPTNTITTTHTPTPTITCTPTLNHSPTPTITLIQTQKPLQRPIVEQSDDEQIDGSGAPSVLGDMNSVAVSSQSGLFEQRKILIISLAFIGSGLAVLTTAVAYRIVLQKKSESNPV